MTQVELAGLSDTSQRFISQLESDVRNVTLSKTFDVLAVQAVLDWVVFNAVIGNADAHAKNLALLCDRDGYRRLAPYYDLVPTIVIPERLAERQPSLRIGASERIDRITADDWRAFAKAAGYAPGYVLKRVVTMAEAVAAQSGDVMTALVEQGADRARMERAIGECGTGASAHLRQRRGCVGKRDKNAVYRKVGTDERKRSG